MRFSTVTLAVVAAVAYAQDISDIPSCALQCFLGPLQSDGCSSLTDFKCHCQKPDLVSKVVPCVAKSCPKDVQSEVSEKAVALCKKYGVDITIPSGGSSPSTSAKAPESTSSAAGESSYPSSASVSATPTVSGTGSLPTYPAPSNGTYPSGTPSPIPTGAASKASFGGAVAAVAGVAALAAF